MNTSDPSGGLNRRQFLRAAGIGAMSSPLAPLLAGRVSGSVSAEEEGPQGIPGPYPGRVIEVTHAGVIARTAIDREVVRSSMERGMRELTGADDGVAAWRRFFEPGDRVGIKVNPVGNPLANTSKEVLLETIAGLLSAGSARRTS